MNHVRTCEKSHQHRRVCHQSVTKPVSFEISTKMSKTGMGCYILTSGLTVNNSDWTVSQTSLSKILVVRFILVLWGSTGTLNFHVLKCWIFSFEGEGFSCSLCVLYGGLRIKNCNFQKDNFFFTFLVIKILDLKPDTGPQLRNMLDPDPH